MAIDHNETVQNIKTIRDAVRGVAQKAITYNNKKGEIIKSEYMTELAKSEETKKIADKYKAECIPVENKIQIALDSILEAELANNKMFDINAPELQNTISYIEAVGNRASKETIKNIVNTFKGNYQGLIMLKDIFATYGIDAKYLDKNIIDIENEIAELKNLTASMFEDANTTTYKMQKICDSLYDIANTLGAPFDDADKETGLDIDEYMTSLAKSVMGL